MSLTISYNRQSGQDYRRLTRGRTGTAIIASQSVEGIYDSDELVRVPGVLKTGTSSTASKKVKGFYDPHFCREKCKVKLQF